MNKQVSSAILKYGIDIHRPAEGGDSRKISLVLQETPKQVELMFRENNPSFELEDVRDDYLGIYLPLSYWSDMLLALDGWKIRTFKCEYDPKTRSLGKCGIEADIGFDP